MSEIACTRCGEPFDQNPNDPVWLSVHNPKHMPAFHGDLILNICPDCYKSFEEWWHDD